MRTLGLRRLAAAALALAAVGSLTGLDPAHGEARSTVIDTYSRYEPQDGCRRTPQPGTDALHRWILRTWPGTASSGMIRDCASGGMSEHKDGRAIDWAVDVRDPAGKEAGYGFIEKVLAADKHGNPHALARRLGIMYIIFDDTIWSAYRGFEPAPYLNGACATRKGCSDSLRHLNHVHVSLSRAGGAAQTSWYRARNVPSTPVLLPGTRLLDADSTAVHTLEVPTDGSTVRTPFQLTRGASYTLLADGFARYGTGDRVTDANCVYNRRVGAFTPIDPATSPGRGLLVGNGQLPWGATCSAGFTYTATWVAGQTAPLRVTYADPTGGGDNAGTFRVHLVRSDIIPRTVLRRAAADTHPEFTPARRGLRAAAGTAALVKETVAVRTDRRTGSATRGVLKADARYRVTVTGTATDAGTLFDGRCTRSGRGLLGQYSMNPTTPGVDHHGVYVAGVKVDLVRSRDRKPRCDGRTHTYTGVLVSPVTGRVRVQTWDPSSYDDNNGTLSVTIRRLGR